MFLSLFSSSLWFFSFLIYFLITLHTSQMFVLTLLAQLKEHLSIVQGSIQHSPLLSPQFVFQHNVHQHQHYWITVDHTCIYTLLPVFFEKKIYIYIYITLLPNIKGIYHDINVIQCPRELYIPLNFDICPDTLLTPLLQQEKWRHSFLLVLGRLEVDTLTENGQ